MINGSVYNYKDIIFSCFQPQESLSEHSLPHHALIYVYSGEIQLTDNGKELRVRAGEYVFLKRDNRVRIHKHTHGSEPYKAISIRFDRKFLREYFRTVKRTRLPQNVKRFKEAVIKLEHSPYIDSLFVSLFPFTDRGIKPSDEFVKMKINEALSYILDADERFYPTLFDFNNPWKMDILEFMEQNYLQDMSLEEFALYTGRSLASFKRDFAEISQLTPQKWLIERRLEKAHELIKEGKSVTDAYIESGFKNRSHFSRAFKSRYGYSPNKAKNLLSNFCNLQQQLNF